MVIEQYYINNVNIKKVENDTDLCLDELELIVGRFAPHSCRAGQLRGQVYVYVDGSIEIRHHFNKKILWKKD